MHSNNRKSISIAFSILFVLVITLSCKKTSDFNIDKYLGLEYGSFDHNDEEIHYVSPIVIDNSDSIGEAANRHSRKIGYLLTNSINVDTLNTLIPDSLAIDSVFHKKINTETFIENFRRIVNPNQQPKLTFTQNEMMAIASKFFLAEALGENKFSTRICSGINGITYKTQDYILLEAVVFDAIFSRLLENDKPEAKFMGNLEKYQDSIIKITEDLDSKVRLNTIRNGVYSAMENDHDLKMYLIDYFKVNQNDIPIKLSSD